MRVLIITQKVDLNDDLLGFMHGWIVEFAKKCEFATVVCLQKGAYKLPPNVRVLSLGKESGKSRVGYIFAFYRHIFKERKNYDVVFVHMNREYVILGGLFWRIWGKKITFWYNHIQGNIFTDLAAWLSDKIFYTSPFAYTAKFQNARIMPAGIDTERFKRDPALIKKGNSLLFVGRVSPVKNVETLIEAAKILDYDKIEFTLKIIAEAPERDKGYFSKIKLAAQELVQKGKIIFMGRMPNYMLPAIYNENEILINLTNSGSLDKVVLEAMACESLILVSNNSFERELPVDFKDRLIFREKDAGDLAEKIKGLLALANGEKARVGVGLSEIARRGHALDLLVEMIFEEFSKK